MGGSIFAVNLLLSSCILLSGNNFSKINMFTSMFGLCGISRSTFHRHQRHFLCSAINQLWELSQNQLLQQYTSKPLILSGDARNDSPGSSAKFCAYSFMEQVCLYASIIFLRCILKMLYSTYAGYRGHHSCGDC